MKRAKNIRTLQEPPSSLFILPLPKLTGLIPAIADFTTFEAGSWSSAQRTIRTSKSWSSREHLKKRKWEAIRVRVFCSNLSAEKNITRLPTAILALPLTTRFFCARTDFGSEQTRKKWVSSFSAADRRHSLFSSGPWHGRWSVMARRETTLRLPWLCRSPKQNPMQRGNALVSG